MAPTVNIAIQLGNLTRDPELNYKEIRGEQKAVANFGLAVQRANDPDTADFFEWSVWGKQAEALAEYKKKGEPIHVEGRSVYRTWEDDSGNKRSMVSYVAYKIQYLYSKRAEENAAKNKGDADVEEETDFQDIPF